MLSKWFRTHTLSANGEVQRFRSINMVSLDKDVSSDLSIYRLYLTTPLKKYEPRIRYTRLPFSYGSGKEYFEVYGRGRNTRGQVLLKVLVMGFKIKKAVSIWGDF
ncbi:hypothetical protein Tco_1507198 [Tanacetum coccineum]